MGVGSCLGLRWPVSQLPLLLQLARAAKERPAKVVWRVGALPMYTSLLLPTEYLGTHMCSTEYLDVLQTEVPVNCGVRTIDKPKSRRACLDGRKVPGSNQAESLESAHVFLTSLYVHGYCIEPQHGTGTRRCMSPVVMACVMGNVQRSGSKWNGISWHQQGLRDQVQHGSSCKRYLLVLGLHCCPAPPFFFSSSAALLRARYLSLAFDISARVFRLLAARSIFCRSSSSYSRFLFCDSAS